MAVRGLTTLSRNWLIAGLVLALAACSGASNRQASEAERAAIEAALRSDIAILASNDFEGRRPGTNGEAKTLQFIEDSLKRAGYVSGTNDPANPWRAPVPLISTRASSSRVAIQRGKRTVILPDDAAFAFTPAKLGLVEQGEVIFVGHKAEQLSRDDVLGRVAVMLSEPGKSPARRELLFDMGAAAIITVVSDKSGVEQFRQSRMAQRFVLAGDGDNDLGVFVTADAMEDALGDDRWQDLIDLSGRDDFAPIKLEATASVEARSDRRELTSFNIVGQLPGANPATGAVMLVAHWDHFGECGADGDSDRLCNGAVDNASGVATMLELARRLARSAPHDRDIYVLATTAEESGLLGAKAFAKNPAMPLEKIVAAFNYDSSAVAPRGSDVALVGEGMTPLDGIILQTLADRRQSLGSQILAEQFLRRQDSWALLEAGVPAVTLSTNLGSQDALNRFLSERYHQASDESDTIELGGAVDDVLLHELLLQRVASTAHYPASGE